MTVPTVEEILAKAERSLREECRELDHEVIRIAGAPTITVVVFESETKTQSGETRSRVRVVVYANDRQLVSAIADESTWAT